MESMKPPLYMGWGSLFQWVGAFCIREVDRCCHSLDMGVLTCFTPPFVMFGLPTMTQFCEWLHSSWGSLSPSINGYWCHSLHLTYMFLLRSAATSCYLRSSWCLGRHPWQKLQLPIFPPKGSLTGRSLGECLTIILLWHPLSFTSCRGSLAWGGLVHLSHAWWLPIHKGMPISDVMRRSRFQWRTRDLLCWFITS